jgi:hypothetical protein
MDSRREALRGELFLLGERSPLKSILLWLAPIDVSPSSRTGNNEVRLLFFSVLIGPADERRLEGGPMEDPG